MTATYAKAGKHRVGSLSALAVSVAAIAVSCGTDFEDGSMAELRKPELLSIVLEPPEAAPGDTVTAAFLMADDHGAIEDAAVMWLPLFDLNDRGGRRRSGAGEVTFDPEWDLSELMQPELSLTVGERSQYDFDEQGFAEHALGLLAFVGEMPDLDAPLEMDPDDLDALLDSDGVKLGIRSLVISDRPDKNRNPRVTGIRWGRDAERQPNELRLVTSSDANMAALRRAAAADPLEVEENSTVHFDVRVEDDDPVEQAIRYQWIATGGDFGGFRERVQKWKAPGFKEPDPENGEEDQSGQSDVEPRTDPNLHPVWVVLRDSGVPGHLGQSWAEFYVRVMPADGQ